MPHCPLGIGETVDDWIDYDTIIQMYIVKMMVTVFNSIFHR